MRPLQLKAAAAAAGRGTETDILVLLRLRDRMKQQLMDFSTAVRASRQSYVGNNIEGNIATKATEDLIREMEEIKVSFQNKTLALQRIQVMFALRNKMKKNDNDSRQIMETLKHTVILSQTVINYQMQIREKQQKLTDMRMKRLSLKKAGGQKIQQLFTTMKNRKEKQANTEVRKMLETFHNDLKIEREITTLIQNVFQNIIIGSKVNWARDPSLKAVVLQLEKNVYFL